MPGRATRTMRIATRTSLFDPAITVWCPGAFLLPRNTPLVKKKLLGVVVKEAEYL